MPRLGVMLAVLVAFTLPVAAQAPTSAPLPPSKPLALTTKHSERLLIGLALRFGFDQFFLPGLGQVKYDYQDDSVELTLEKIRLHAAYIPQWVTELPPEQLLPSLQALSACKFLADHLPSERPEETVGLSCGHYAGQTTMNNPSLLFIEQVWLDSFRGRLWHNGVFSQRIAVQLHPREMARQ